MRNTKRKWGTVRNTMQHIASITNRQGKVLAVYPVTKQNKQNVECNTVSGKITIWNSNKVVVRGVNGKYVSFQL